LSRIVKAKEANYLKKELPAAQNEGNISVFWNKRIPSDSNRGYVQDIRRVGRKHIARKYSLCKVCDNGFYTNIVARSLYGYRMRFYKQNQIQGGILYATETACGCKSLPYKYRQII